MVGLLRADRMVGENNSLSRIFVVRDGEGRRLLAIYRVNSRQNATNLSSFLFVVFVPLFWGGGQEPRWISQKHKALPNERKHTRLAREGGQIYPSRFEFAYLPLLVAQALFCRVRLHFVFQGGRVFGMFCSFAFPPFPSII